MPWTWCHCGMRVRREARRHTPSRRASHSSDTPFVVRGTDADGGSRTLMAQWPPVSETGAYSDSATSARRAAGRDAGGRLVVLKRPAAGAAARVVRPRDVPDGGSRARRPLPGAAAAWDEPPPGPGGGASPLLSVNEAGLPGVEPGPARLELAVLPLHHRPSRADDPDRTGLSGVALRCSSV
jgi:hypothetical protein